MRSAAVSLLLILLCMPAWSAEWIVNDTASRVRFMVQVSAPDGDERKIVDGKITDWDAQIIFDPATPETASITATLNLQSASTGDGGFDQQMNGPNWLNTEAHPVAAYRAAGFRELYPGYYEINGRLSLNGITKPLQLHASIRTNDDSAYSQMQVSLSRLAFDIGQNTPDDLVSLVVNVAIEVYAFKRP